MRPLLAASFLLLLSCGGSKPPTAARTVVDFRGKAVGLPARPERIVSLVPGATELLFAAGAGGQVVGVTTWCNYPEEAKSRTKVGDLQVNWELLKSLRPDLVVTAWSLTRTSGEAVEELGIPVFSVDPRSLADVSRALRLLGEVTGRAEEAERAARSVEERVAAVERRVAGRPRPSVLLEMTSTPHVAVAGSYGHDVIVRAGGRNVFEDVAGDRFAAVSWEAALARDPDVYVVAHGYEPPDGRPGFAALRAVREGRYFRFDLQDFSFPTPRLVRGLERLAEKLHP